METRKFELEDEISNIIKNDNGCTVHFEYKNADNTNPFAWVFVTTFNKNNGETFLLNHSFGETFIDALEKVLEYVKNHTKTHYSHTVIWSLKSKPSTNTSYFYANDALDALKKFFYKKERSDYVIYEVKLNPIA